MESILVLLVVVLVIFLIILDRQLSKWLFGEKRQKISESDGETIHKWGIGILAFVGVGVYILIDIFISENYITVYWMGLIFILIILMFSLEAFLEWKYLKDSKQYLIPLLLIGISVAGMAGIFFIEHQMKYTTFPEVVPVQLNEVTTIRSISITINDLSGSLPDREAKTTIENGKMIEQILDDFSEMELKKLMIIMD